MKEILNKHLYWGYVDGIGRTRCECGEWFDHDAGYVQHLHDALVAAGYGDVAGAFEAAAEEVHDREVGLDSRTLTAERGYMQRHNRFEVAKWLRARAAQLRS